MSNHNPPFKNEVLVYSEIAAKGNIFDLYGGDASYGVLLLRKFPDLHYWYFDLDQSALDTATERLLEFGQKAHIKRCNARDLDKRISEEGLREIDVAIYDPGLRLGHVENPERGFLVKWHGPLDGRYDQRQQLTIADVLNHESVDVLTDIFTTVEMPFPRRLAEAIVNRRKSGSISTSRELTEIVSKAIPFKARRKKVSLEVIAMLALRIYVNDELGALAEAVRKGFSALRPGGRLLTISYHSGEARIYKEFAKKYDERYAAENERKLRVLTKKALKPSTEEIGDNPLIRSSQFRVYEKLN